MGQAGAGLAGGGGATSPPTAALWRYGLAKLGEAARVQGLLPRRRWVAERTFAWLSQVVRRLSKDYERLPEVAEAMIYGAMSRLMLRRLAKGAV